MNISNFIKTVKLLHEVKNNKNYEAGMELVDQVRTYLHNHGVEEEDVVSAVNLVIKYSGKIKKASGK